MATPTDREDDQICANGSCHGFCKPFRIRPPRATAMVREHQHLRSEIRVALDERVEANLINVARNQQARRIA